jgi:DNA modification methylase
MQALIELTTKPDQIVLDPFAGSGSTLVAAKNLGRKYFGYEIDQKYVDTCEGRLDDSGLLSFMK